MPTDTILHLINNMGNAKRENRDKAARFILKQPIYFEDLLELSLNISYKFHYKAAWVLELVLEKNLHNIFPYLNLFCASIGAVKNDSAARPLAKISLWVVEVYVKQTDIILLQYTSNTQINQLITTNFDWLIGNFKVATKVHAMDTLFLLSQLNNEQTHWIREQLQGVLLEQISYGSAGFQNHSKKILQKIEKN